jgi:hypothetical protein
VDGTLWGGPREITVAGGVGSGSSYSYAIWDTHEYGSDITFVACKGTGVRTAGHGIFQIRAKRVRIVSGEGKHGFRGITAVADASEDLRVEGGDYSFNDEVGVADSGVRTHVVGAHIHHNGSYGISGGFSSVDAVYRENDIIDNDGAGISFRPSTPPGSFATNPLVQGNNIPFSAGQFWGVENLPATGRAYENVLLGYAGQGGSNAFRTANAAARIKRNDGFVTENGGIATVANGGTISHGLARTPTRVNLTPSVSGRRVQYTAISATTITVALQDSAGANVSVAEPVAWMAEA